MATRRRASPDSGAERKQAASSSSGPSLNAPNTLLEKLIRFSGVMSWIFVSYPILFSGAVLRCLNPLLRARGTVNGRMPSDFIQMTWGSVIVWLTGVNVVVEGWEHLISLQKRSSVVMANHASALDPFILMGYGLVAPKYLFKRSLIFQVPPIFLLAWAYGHIPINRTNRESAISSLHGAARRIQKYNRAIAIFPEGTRSKDGRLIPFKRGPFHLAHDVRVPICPMYLEGAWDLHNSAAYSFFPDSGTVKLRILPAIENTESDTIDTLEKKVRDVMEKAQSERKPLPHTTAGFASLVGCVIFIVLAVLEVRFICGLFF